jgi:hypothetical protein
VILAKKAKIGDIYEVRTPAGLAYLQYSHDGGDMGELVRVLPGLFRSRPTDFAELARQRELYFAFYTLKYALRNGQAEVVSRQPVPDWARRYPMMRWPGARDRTGKIVSWKIFRASEPLTIETHKRIPFVRTLTPEQEKLSIHQLWPHPVMVKELARRWTPVRAEELRLQDTDEGTKCQTEGASYSETLEKGMRHFLYFPEKADAESASVRLRDLEFSVEIRRGADGINWLVLATGDPPKNAEQMDELRGDMEALAAQFRGEYDGWEAAVDALSRGGGDHGQRLN